MRGALEAVCLFLLTACASAPPSADGQRAADATSAPEVSEPDQAALAAEGDPDLERALRAAIELERDRSVPPEPKIRAWQVVVDVAGDKQVGELAAARVEEWTTVIEVEKRRPETLRILRESYDKHVVEVRSGAMTVKAFCQGYRNHIDDLLEIGVEPPYKALCGNPPPLTPGMGRPSSGRG